MANSIDIGAIALGACIGYGLREEIKSSAGVCKSALLAAATVAAATTAAAVDGAKGAEKPQSQPQGATAGQANGNGGNANGH